MEVDNIKKGQGTWRKGIPGLAELTPLAIPSAQITSIIVIVIFVYNLQNSTTDHLVIVYVF